MTSTLKKKSLGLNILLQSLRGKYVTVVLKNELHLEGKLEEVSKGMDLTMSDVLQRRTLRGTEQRLEEMYISGKMILFVDIPKDINIKHAISIHTRRLSRGATEFSRQKRKKE